MTLRDALHDESWPKIRPRLASGAEIDRPVGHFFDSQGHRDLNLLPTEDSDYERIVQRKYPARPVTEGTGGAPDFLRFLREELIPRVEAGSADRGILTELIEMEERSTTPSPPRIGPAYWRLALPAISTWSILIAWVLTIGVPEFEGGRALAMVYLAVPATGLVLLGVAATVFKAAKRSPDAARRAKLGMAVFAVTGVACIGIFAIVSGWAEPAITTQFQ